MLHGTSEMESRRAVRIAAGRKYQLKNFVSNVNQIMLSLLAVNKSDLCSNFCKKIIGPRHFVKDTDT